MKSQTMMPTIATRAAVIMMNSMTGGGTHPPYQGVTIGTLVRKDEAVTRSDEFSPAGDRDGLTAAPGPKLAEDRGDVSAHRVDRPALVVGDGLV
jgi:hypothetical protein